jgi:hypothetical protein
MRIRGRYMQKEIAYRFREGNSKAALPRRLCTSQLLSQKTPSSGAWGSRVASRLLSMAAGVSGDGVPPSLAGSALKVGSAATIPELYLG